MHASCFYKYVGPVFKIITLCLKKLIKLKIFIKAFKFICENTSKTVLLVFQIKKNDQIYNFTDIKKLAVQNNSTVSIFHYEVKKNMLDIANL